MSTFAYIKSLGADNIQQFINDIDADQKGEGGHVDMERLNNVLNFMFTHNWQEVDIADLNENDFPLQGRDQIRYLVQDEDGKIRYRTGGFFIKVIWPGESTINKISLDDQEVENPFIVYYSHNGMNISLQINRIMRMYVKKFKRREKIKVSKIVKFKRPTKKTKFPVCMIDRHGKTRTVYYARDNHERNKFMARGKFLDATKHGWMFEDEE